MNMPSLAFFDSTRCDNMPVITSIVLRAVKNCVCNEECENAIYEDDVINENNGINGFLDLYTSTSTIQPLAKRANLDDL